MNKKLGLILAVTLALGLSACGTNYNGSYSGTMTINGSSATLAMDLQNSGGTVSGTFVTSGTVNTAGTITGSTSGGTYTATMTIPSTFSGQGTYSGTLTLSSGTLTGTLTNTTTTSETAVISATQSN
jgi:hypothetical protein